MIKDIYCSEFPYEVLTAEDESLMYLESEGWRWETCDAVDCHGTGVVAIDAEDEEGRPIQGADNCPYCSGKGGEWVKED